MQFAYYLLTRSGRISYDELRRRDFAFVDATNRWFQTATCGASDANLRLVASPPMLAPFRLRDLTLHNRVVVPMSVVFNSCDGLPPEPVISEIDELIHSGAALIITNPLAVSRDGRVTAGCMGIYDREHVALWSRIAKIVHRGRIKLAASLNHCGRRGATRTRDHGLDLPLESAGWPLLSASAISFRRDGRVPKEMDRDDMNRVRDQFTDAARRADEAGFDMIELYFAHGYLMASFLSPLTNHREDEYGGALENRLRYPLEIIDAVRAAWPQSKPLCIAISATDCAKNGLEPEEASAIACAMKEHGADIINVFAGQNTIESRPRYSSCFLTPFSDRIRNEARVPTMTGGNISTTDQVNNIVAAGRADLCIMEPPRLNVHHRMIETDEARRG